MMNSETDDTMDSREAVNRSHLGSKGRKVERAVELLHENAHVLSAAFDLHALVKRLARGTYPYEVLATQARVLLAQIGPFAPVASASVQSEPPALTSVAVAEPQETSGTEQEPKARDETDDLVSLSAWHEANPKSSFFPSLASIQWFVRTNREELTRRGAYFPRGGRLGALISKSVFPLVAVEIARREAQAELAKARAGDSGGTSAGADL